MARNWFAHTFGGPRWRIGVTLACLLTFTLQSFLAQAHVHTTLERVAGLHNAALAAVPEDARNAPRLGRADAGASDQQQVVDRHSATLYGKHSGQPDNSLDRQNTAPSKAADESGASQPAPKRFGTETLCPLCQFLLLSGAPLFSVLCALALIVPVLRLVPARRVAPDIVSAVSYSWQGRGPPLI